MKWKGYSDSGNTVAFGEKVQRESLSVKIFSLAILGNFGSHLFS